MSRTSRNYGNNNSRNKNSRNRNLRNLKNGDDRETREQQARELAIGFHGRDVRDWEDIIEVERYEDYGATLGDLEEINILCEDSLNRKNVEVFPIGFEIDKKNVIRLTGNRQRNQLLFFSKGKQHIEGLEEEFDIVLDREDEDWKQYQEIGRVFSIVYYTDKHHLEGPKSQETGSSYEHEFGEEDEKDGKERRLPTLVYDCLNFKMILVGGGYKIKDVGIWN